MRWTPEQLEILEHPPDAHALVHAVPGAGKTTTLVGRVERLCNGGVDPRRIRVVMFNKAIQETFTQRLVGAGIRGVHVTTFDALGLEVLRAAGRQGKLSAPLEVVARRTQEWAKAVHRNFFKTIETAEDIADSVYFWKAHMVSPKRAACAHQPAIVEAYRAVEALRCAGPTLQVDFPDMVYTAVGVLRQHPHLLGAIDHFLVDEFQDINPGRIELMRRLMHTKTSVLAVGDADQAIYEWAGAHPRFFSEFASTFAVLPTRHYPLSRSFRFGPTIAQAAARLIAHNQDRAPLIVVGGGATEGRIDRIDDVADTVQALLAKDHAPGEIAVLYRGRAQGVSVLAELAARRIPMNTDDIDMLRKGRGPELALAYLGFATTDASVDFDAAWAVVYAPDRYVRKDAFRAQVGKLGRRGLQAVLRDARLARVLEQPHGAIAAMRDLADLLLRMGRCATAGQALDLLVRETDVAGQLAGRMRSESEQELALAAFNAVHVLLRGLGVAPKDATMALISLDPQMGQPADRCVWVSTIHKAKGREWRSVLLPRLIDGLCPAGQRGERPGTVDEPEGIAQSDWLEQERRIFYVGLTRAVDAVFLEAPRDNPSSFIAELSPPKPRQPARTPAGPASPERRKAWSPEEDVALTAGWVAREGLDSLAARFGRSTRAISARLVHLGVVGSRGDARKRG